jgi:hypothetical protein
MKALSLHSLRLSILLFFPTLSMVAAAASAQTAAPAKAPAAKPAAAPVPASAAPKAKKPAAPVEQPLPPADADQTAAAAMIHIGNYVCEFKQPLQVSVNPKYDGYVDVSFGKLRYTMKPVLSTTGALRLEDVKGQTLMLQIAYKSMLMDVKVGRRLVDECVHEKQAQAKAAAEGKPAESMLSNDAAKPAQ